MRVTHALTLALSIMVHSLWTPVSAQTQTERRAIGDTTAGVSPKSSLISPGLAEQPPVTRDYKPARGAHVIEAGIVPLGTGPFGWSNGLRYRRFVRQKKVFRAEANVNVEYKHRYITPDDPAALEQFFETRRSTLSLNLAFERHLEGTHRVSPYFGFGLGGIINTTLETLDELRDGWILSGSSIYSLRNGDGYYGIKAFGFVGLDAYVTERLYLGTEFPFGFIATYPLASYMYGRNVDMLRTRRRVETGSSLAPLTLPQIRVGFVL